VAEAAIGFGDSASWFFDVDYSGSPSNRPPATNFSAIACAMPNSEKMRSRKPGSSSNPRWTEGAASAGSPSRRHGAMAASRPFVVAGRTSTITALTIGRLSQDLRGDAIRTQSSLTNGVVAKLVSAVKHIRGLARDPKSSPPHSRCRSRCGSARPTVQSPRAIRGRLQNASSRPDARSVFRCRLS
jgi:hypothetical protein